MDCKKTQDLPPPGGYKPINFARVPAKQVISTAGLVIVYFLTSLPAFYLAMLSVKRYDKQKTEERSSMMALYPMLLAERDRAYLKQLIKNREEEKDLMKNVQGWSVGTWFGELPYLHYPKDKLLPENHNEFYAHSSPTAYYKWSEFRRWS